jgi:multiple antibiotic resistance protein
LIGWFVFNQSQWIMRILKEGGAKGIGKVSSLLLAAFAVMVIRTGIMEWVNLFPKMR